MGGNYLFNFFKTFLMRVGYEFSSCLNRIEVYFFLQYEDHGQNSNRKVLCMLLGFVTLPQLGRELFPLHWVGMGASLAIGPREDNNEP